ncbi:TetR/AcrR family transcriptional regulator [Paenibacillus typhae]|uniref:Transcriptional regulator, TetR family n=1 Tax=Paenibacillus typhae TaxID=1174501 RepID=A0A1G9CSR3_9BACL|nr:TetR family transcriptional regulator [Paenibacillus typhae]SDK54454.1 transcriptional regulator, TetR family [Paenibacillus typhae]
MANMLSPNPNDPRVIRTRQLILDAFLRLLNTKDFNQITISDITGNATINRATFYAHFADKYALLEAMLSSAFTTLVVQKLDTEATLTDQTLLELIGALCAYHESSQHCVKKYDSVALLIEENIKLQLEQLILSLLSKTTSTPAQPKALASAATLLSWSIYGVTYRWNQDGRTEAPAELAKRVSPFIIGGVSHLHSIT